MTALTASDKQWLHGIGVAADEPMPVVCRPEDYERLLRQLREDLDASEGDRRAANQSYDCVVQAYGRLEAECAALHRRVRQGRRMARVGAVAGLVCGAAMAAGVTTWLLW